MTKNLTTAFGMGIAALVVLVCSNMIISALRKIIPENVRIPCYIVVIASFVTMVGMIIHAFIPDLYDSLGDFLDLITVNCIILGRAEMYARKHGPLDSALDGLGMGLGFLVALLGMAIIREILGTGAIDLSSLGMEAITIPVLCDYNIPILTAAPGGFLVYGILIAIVNKIGPKAGSEKRKNFSCEGCPSASICGRVSCSENAELAHAAEENTLVKKEDK
jgi:electron transport complex protein RnfE